MSALRTGCLVVVVGASGAGKDSVLTASKSILVSCNDIHFVQRFITRDAIADNESHVPVSSEQFQRLEQAGGFSVTWQAHGFHYGVPVDTTAKVQNGQTVILNGSRSALPMIRKVYPSLRTVHLLVDDAILARRLAGRGRETPDQIQQRLTRHVSMTTCDAHDKIIHNNGALEETVTTFVAFVQSVRLGNDKHDEQAKCCT